MRDRDRYSIIGEHGRGGLGLVLRARDKELGRDVAIKEMFSREFTAEVRFFREALITARLEHPGIVPVHEAGRWSDGTPFYAMKLVAGKPFKQLIESTPDLVERLTYLPNLVAVADAIAYAHGQRVIHRDLKPSNVIIGEFGETVVIDWGLAKVLDQPSDESVDGEPARSAPTSDLTVAGSVVGTPAYMAPEQLLGKADERSDIYALGGILRDLLAGGPPSRDAREPDETPQLPQIIPRDLRAVVTRAMHPRADHRYPSARAFADDLRRFGRHESVSARKYSWPALAYLTFARHRMAAIVLMAALFALALTSTLFLVGVTRQRDAAEQARLAAQVFNDGLILNNAELLATKDPTAALRMLSEYHGDNAIKRELLMAEIHALGVSARSYRLHTNVMDALVPQADGVLLSFSQEPQLGYSSPEETRTIATDVGIAVPIHSPVTGLAAYASAPGPIKLLNSNSVVVDTVATTGRVLDMAFSPAGRYLAFTTDDGTVASYDTESRALAVLASVDSSRAVVFATEHELAVLTANRLLSLSMSSNRTPVSKPLLGGTALAATRGEFLVGTSEGSVLVIDAASLLDRTILSTCHGTVNAIVTFSSDEFAFACANGGAGLWNLRGAGDIKYLSRETSSAVAVSQDERYVCAAIQNSLRIYDRKMGVTTNYIGHDALITTVLAPTDLFPHFASGDFDGQVRVWPKPSDRSAYVMQS